MGHTAGLHTRSREVAVRVGSELPASRITVNTPTTHGAIGFSTALPPSMTLGCGSWGGNVTSDNVSPLHLMDIKRIAFETRPVKSTRPAASAHVLTMPATPAQLGRRAPSPQQAAIAGSAGKINREEIAAIVDKFLAGRRPSDMDDPREPPRETSRAVEVEAGSMYSGPGNQSRENAETRGNGGRASQPSSTSGINAAANSRAAVDFVSEDDVRRAIQKGEKIYINSKTIITPAARDIGEPGEVFAKV
jgi:hypothetical protein